MNDHSKMILYVQEVMVLCLQIFESERRSTAQKLEMNSAWRATFAESPVRICTCLASYSVVYVYEYIQVYILTHLQMILNLES